MSINIAGIEFDNHEYDERGDVLYADVTGYRGPSPRAYVSPEGHGIEWDEQDRVVAMTLVNVRRLIERDGDLRITWPDGHVSHDAGPTVLTPAA